MKHPVPDGVKGIDVLAVLPAYNETRSIANVVAATLIHLPVVVVDDGSTDDTTARAQAAGATVLRQQPNQGKGAALRAGFGWAVDQGYSAVVTLGADGQHDPAEIPKFLDARATRTADLIIGVRDFSQMPLIRRISNTLGRAAFSWAVGEMIRDNQCGYRLISRRLLEILLRSHEPGFEFEVEMIVTCLNHDFTLDWIPIRTIYSGEASHIAPLSHVAHFLRVVWQTRNRTQQRARRS